MSRPIPAHVAFVQLARDTQKLSALLLKISRQPHWTRSAAPAAEGLQHLARQAAAIAEAAEAAEGWEVVEPASSTADVTPTHATARA